MNKVIKIEDYPCGSGKTTRMIENFKEDQKYLVILPLLSEVDRVIEAAKGIKFVQPDKNDNEQKVECIAGQGDNFVVNCEISKLFIGQSLRIFTSLGNK